MATNRGSEIKKQLLDVLKELRLLNAEIDKANKAGATRQQIEAKYGEKLKETQQAYFNVINTVKQYEAVNRGNVKTNDKLDKSIKSLVQTLNTVRGAHSSLTTAVGKQSAEEKKLSESLKRQETQTKKAAKETQTFGSAFKKAFSPAAWGSAIANLIKFLGVYQLLSSAIQTVKDITIGSAKAFIDFQDSIGKLRAVSKASADETQVLSDSIRKTAVETRFTATQVTDLATSLAKLGATAEEIPSLILPVSLAAQALGASLDDVGETIFKVNNQFGLSAEESASTAQSLVAAINESALSLETFNTAIQYIGPIASQVGLTFSETSGYLKVLADNGFSASRIGTGLRGIFVDLKEAGVPLIDTLERLAEENISVARATDLVGKRAAGQLISLLDNLDALKESIDPNQQFIESLQASAAQMSTVAGQLDILKSAYEDLRISIGDTIVSSELFLDIIGLLSIKSEQLARGYKDLDTVLSSEKGTEVFRKNIDTLLSGTIDSIGSFEAALNTLRSLGQSGEVVSILDDLRAAGLSLGEAQAILSKRINDGGPATSQMLKGYELTTAQLKQVNLALARTNDEVENQFNGLRGLANITLKEAQAIETANQVSNERNAIEQSYAETIEKVKRLGPGSIAAKEAARKVQKELNDKIKETNALIEEEEKRGVSTNKALVNQLKGRVSGYEKVRKQLADLTYEDDDATKKREAARKKELKLDKDAIELRRAEIKEEIRQIKKIRDERIKAIKEQKARDLERASTAEKAADIEIKAAQDIAEANAEVEDSLVQVSNKTKKLTEDTIDLQTKYKKDFPDAFDDFALSFEKILFDIQSAITDVQFTPEELADQLVGQASSVFKEFEQNLASLKDYYGDTIQGQRDFAIASQDQFQKLKDNVDKITQQYNQTKAALTLLLGEDAANEILAPVAGSIDIISNKLNELGFNIEKNATEIAENTKLEIKSILVDGLGDALAAAIEALDKFNETAFNNTKDRLDREKDQIEARYEIEEDILKSQLQNQLITEEEFRTRQTKLRQKQIGEENAIEKALFDAQQKRDRQSATTDYLQALASIVPNLIITDKEADPVTIAIKSAITAGIATVSYGAELGAISQRKFIPKKFAEGGMVEGPSHAQGGVPFTVQGRGGYEMEGGEFIVNKRAAQLHRTVLERINNSTKSTAITGKYTYSNDSALRKFAEGGIVGVSQSVQQASSEQLEYLRAIAEATTSTAVGVSKPVRAYVSSSDLNTNEAERKIKERNTRI